MAMIYVRDYESDTTEAGTTDIISDLQYGDGIAFNIPTGEGMTQVTFYVADSIDGTFGLLRDITTNTALDAFTVENGDHWYNVPTDYNQHACLKLVATGGTASTLRVLVKQASR